MAVIGGDLGAMSALTSRFSSAGEAFQSQSAGIATGVDRALQEFVGEMRGLDTEARALAGEIRAEMARLNARAQATTWTGTHRQQMDGVVATLDDDIVKIQQAIEGFIDEASTVVNGSLTTALNDVSSHTTTAGSKATQIAGSFSTSVDAQRVAFDQVMNG